MSTRARLAGLVSVALSALLVLKVPPADAAAAATAAAGSPSKKMKAPKASTASTASTARAPAPKARPSARTVKRARASTPRRPTADPSAARPAAPVVSAQAVATDESVVAMPPVAQLTPAPPAARPPAATAPLPGLAVTPVAGFNQLQAIARIAADRNASIREAMAATRAAELDIREASGARLPQLNVDVTSSHTSGGGVVKTSESRGSPYYAVTGSMPVYDWGRTARVVDSRSASWRASGARLDGTLESVALETTLAALELARARAGVIAVDAYVGNMQRLVDMLIAITREDPGRTGELTQARSRVLQAQVTRDGLQSRVREAGIALDRLTGGGAQPIDAIATAFVAVPPLASLLAEVPDQPLLRQLEAETQAQSNLAESLRSARRPQVGVVASHAPVSPGLAGGYASYAGVTVSVPLYRGASDIAAQRAAQERANGAEERRQQSEVDLAARIRTLHQSATTLLARDEEFDRLLRESDAVRKGFFEQWYQMGRRSLFELLAVENEHYGLQAARLNTRFDGLVASARLRGELGTLARWLGLRG